MATISLCMIVKNEEQVLARCLDSVADLMDEIIIVDGGSSDGTAELVWEWEARGLPLSLLMQPGANIVSRV